MEMWMKGLESEKYWIVGWMLTVKVLRNRIGVSHRKKTVVGYGDDERNNSR